MAQFNPELRPTQDPNYDRISQPSRVPSPIQVQGVAQNTILPKGVEQGDRSAAYAGEAGAAGMQAEAQGTKGFGDLFAGIAETGNFMAKAGVQMVTKNIEDKVYQTASDIRSAYTDQLEKIKAGKGVNSILNANASMDTPPPDIENLPDTLDSLVSARDSGKISGTYYQGALLSAAKDLRSRYPGFKQEIDDQFAKVTGTNPANAYITGLVGDINAATANANSEKNKLLTYILHNQKYPGAEGAYQKVQNGEWSGTDVIKWSSPYAKQDYELNTRAALRADNKGTREEIAAKAKDDADHGAAIIVSRHVDEFMNKLGIHSASDAANLDSMEKAGQISPQKYQDYGQQLRDRMSNLKITMLADADKSGLTQQVGGKDEMIKRIDASLEPMRDLTDRVYHHDFGGLYSAQQHIKGQTDDDERRLLADSKVGPIFRSIKVQKSIGGEQFLQSENVRLLTADLPKQYKNYTESWIRGIHTQTNMATTGQPVTFNDMLDEFKAKGVNDKKVNASIVDEVSRIADPNVPDKIRTNIALAAFSPGNRGMISRLNVDGFDSKGNPVTGQSAVYQKWTSPGQTREMAKLGKDDPKIWTNYVDWAKETFGNDLVNKEINQLALVPPNSGVQVGWDSTNKRLVVNDTRSEEQRQVQDRARGGRSDMASGSYFNTVQRSINNINNNLSGLRHIIEASSTDKNAVDGFMLGTIAEAGGNQALKNVQGIPYEIMRQIGLTKLKK